MALISVILINRKGISVNSDWKWTCRPSLEYVRSVIYLGVIKEVNVPHKGLVLFIYYPLITTRPLYVQSCIPICFTGRRRRHPEVKLPKNKAGFGCGPCECSTGTMNSCVRLRTSKALHDCFFSCKMSTMLVLALLVWVRLRGRNAKDSVWNVVPKPAGSAEFGAVVQVADPQAPFLTYPVQNPEVRPQKSVDFRTWWFRCLVKSVNHWNSNKACVHLQ